MVRLHTLSSWLPKHKAGLEFYLLEGKAIFILKRALPSENLKVYGNFVKGHQGQNKCNRVHGLHGLREIPGLTKVLPGGMRQSCYGLPGGMRQSCYGLPGGMRQSCYGLPGGMRQSCYGLPGGMRQSCYGLPGGMRQSCYGLPGGMRQSCYGLPGGMRQSCYGLPGGMRESCYGFARRYAPIMLWFSRDVRHVRGHIVYKKPLLLSLLLFLFNRWI